MGQATGSQPCSHYLLVCTNSCWRQHEKFTSKSPPNSCFKNLSDFLFVSKIRGPHIPKAVKKMLRLDVTTRPLNSALRKRLKELAHYIVLLRTLVKSCSAASWGQPLCHSFPELRVTQTQGSIIQHITIGHETVWNLALESWIYYTAAFKIVKIQSYPEREAISNFGKSDINSI